MVGWWRLPILFGYAGLLVLRLVSIASQYGGIDVFSFESLVALFALAPVAMLCLVSQHRDAMGILALFVIGFGVWGYYANGGDPIGLLIIIFYQYCLAAVGFLAILIGSHLLKAKS
jgi:hypothetical protein